MPSGSGRRCASLRSGRSRLGARRDPSRGGDEGAAARVAGPACSAKNSPGSSISGPTSSGGPASSPVTRWRCPPLERAPIDALTRNVETLFAAGRDLESRLKQRADELASVQGNLEAHSVELRRAQEDITARAGEALGSAGRLEGLEQLLRAKEKTVASLDSEVDTLRARLGSAEVEVGRLAAVRASSGNFPEAGAVTSDPRGVEVRGEGPAAEHPGHPPEPGWSSRRACRGQGGRPRGPARDEPGHRVGQERRLLAGSPLFDTAWYRST